MQANAFAQGVVAGATVVFAQIWLANADHRRLKALTRVSQFVDSSKSCMAVAWIDIVARNYERSKTTVLS